MPSSEILTLKATTVQRLNARGMHVSTAESCTGGMLSETLTSVSGSSNVFECGFVTYSNRIKSEILHVNPETIDTYGVVSAEVSREMANCAMDISGADIGVGITGVAGPGPDGDIPEGVMFVSACMFGKTLTANLNSQTTNEREYNRQLCVLTALKLINQLLDESE